MHYRSLALVFLFSLLTYSASRAQNLRPGDSTRTVQDATYNRPFISLGKTNTAVGGYFEANANYLDKEMPALELPEGLNFEARRLNLFVYSAISPRIKLLSELEFEHGGAEISVETAIMDFEINQGFNFRTGIILDPIGRFNQNHDAPLWEFVERPLVSTQIIPSTLSEMGFGAHGKFYAGEMIYTYDAYLVNGLDHNIISAEAGRTYLHDGKENLEKFAMDENHSPSYTGRLGIRHRRVGEIGLSYYGGTYNIFEVDKVKIEPKRMLSLAAFDFQFRLGKATLQGEAAMANVQMNDTMPANYGRKQLGAFAEIVYPLFHANILKYNNSLINFAARFDYVDYNYGKYAATGENIRDDIMALTAGLSLRPNGSTVLKLNYRYTWINDFDNNPTVNINGLQFGIASYF